MKTIKTFFLLLFAHSCFSQQVLVKSLTVTGLDTTNFYNDYNFLYPFITHSNEAVQDSINFTLQSDYLITDSNAGLDSNSIKIQLNHAAGDGFTFMNYGIVFTARRLLGLDIFAEASGAYPYGWTNHYLFDLKTGHRYLLGELLNNTNKQQFVSAVITTMKDSMNNYTIEIMNEITAGQRDSSDLDDLRYFLDECMLSPDSSQVLDNNNYYLVNDTLHIDHFCTFPHVAKALEPYFTIPYTADKIRMYLLPEIYEELISQKVKK